MNPLRALLVCLVLALLGPAVTSASAQVPDEITLQGLGQTATLRRTGADTWEWVENNATFRFRTLTQQPSELVIHDASRDMYHHLNLSSRATAWRVGTTAPWNAHYTIVSVRPAASPAVPSTPGCCAWRHPNGTPTCSAPSNAVCQNELKGSFYPGYRCMISGACSP